MSEYDVCFDQIISFLRDNPERLSWRSKGKLPDIFTDEGVSILRSKYISSRNTIVRLGEPSTLPDPAVSEILKISKGYSDVKLCEITREHQYSMLAENMVGFLLEKYISITLESHGWIWCAGDFVKAIDFIKKNNDGTWKAVQVKNRNTTENSSSSAIRNGTDIKKWFRTYSKAARNRKNTNWDAFPEEEFLGLLSENAFFDFIRGYLK